MTIHLSQLELNKILKEYGKPYIDSMTPLHDVVLNENPSPLKAKDQNGNTPLHYAALRGHLNATQAIIPHCIKNHSSYPKVKIEDWTAFDSVKKLR